MKKLFLLLTLLVSFVVGYTQCALPTPGTVLTWTSTTHDPSNPAYRITPVTPSGPLAILGPNSYSINVDGNNPFNYQFQAGSGTATDGYAPMWSIQLLKSSTGAASSVTTNLGVLSTNGSTPTNSVNYFNDTPIPVSRTLSLPINPYFDRSLTFIVNLVQTRYYKSGCFSGTGYALPNGYNITSFEPTSESYLLIEVSPRKTAFVNAGTGVWLGAGSPYGAGTTLAVPYPTNITSGNLLVMIATTRIASIYPVGPPPGWSVYIPVGIGTSGVYFYYKVATGTESGNVTLTYNATTTNGRLSRIFQFTNATTTVHSLNATTNTSTSTFANKTNTDYHNLAVSFIYSGIGGLNIGTFAGTTIPFTEPVQQHTGGNATLGINVGSFSTNGQSTGIGTQPVQNNTTYNFLMKAF